MSDNGWKVILRSKAKNQLVLYDGEKVLVRQPSRSAESSPATYPISHKLDYCATCRRPFTNEQAFMDSNYFQFLEKVHSSESLNMTDLHHAKRRNPANKNRNITLTCLNQGYYEKFFIEESHIGRGYRGTVFRCKHHLDNIILGDYAIKKVPVGDDEAWLTKTLKEVKSLERLHHPNIVLYKHAWLEIHQLSRFGPAIPCLFILMEYADRGNLDDYIQNGLLKQNEIIPLFTDLLHGLSYLHDMGIIHRDLKPQNLLLYGRDRIPILMISDFGECEILDQLQPRQQRSGSTGTIEFMAPELLEDDPITGKPRNIFDNKSDIWSIGMIVYYMLFSRLPFQSALDDIDSLKKEILGFNPLFPTDPAYEGFEGLLEIILLCFRKDPGARPGCEEIITLMKNTSKQKSKSNSNSNNQLIILVFLVVTLMILFLPSLK